MKLEKKSHCLVGQYGVYYVCAKLSILGFNAVPTMGNVKTIDIIAQDPRNGKATGVQVKTQRRTKKDIEKDYFRVRPAIPAKIDEEKEFEVPFVLVYHDDYDENCAPLTRCFVVPKQDMRDLCKKYWTWYKEEKRHKKPNYGQGKAHLSIAIWQLKQYENRWGNLWI